MIDSCTVSSAKPYYPSQSCSLFVSLYVWLALPYPHLCCNWKKANYSAGSGDQRNASKKWNWCYNLVEFLPMGNKKHVESERPLPKLHPRFYVPSVKDIADHHATSVHSKDICTIPSFRMETIIKVGEIWECIIYNCIFPYSWGNFTPTIDQRKENHWLVFSLSYYWKSIPET